MVFIGKSTECCIVFVKYFNEIRFFFIDKELTENVVKFCTFKYTGNLCGNLIRLFRTKTFLVSLLLLPQTIHNNFLLSCLYYFYYYFYKFSFNVLICVLLGEVSFINWRWWRKKKKMLCGKYLSVWLKRKILNLMFCSLVAFAVCVWSVSCDMLCHLV